MTAERDVLKTLGGTVRAVRARVDRALQQSGLRIGQYQVLRVLWDDDGLTPREIAERLDVEMPTVTRTVQRMVRDGFVVREANQSDARSVRIRLSRRGREIEPAVAEILERETSRALTGFSAAERASLVAMLVRISENARE
jgi:DNA-binding MarR family transcriptional regulator